MRRALLQTGVAVSLGKLLTACGGGGGNDTPALTDPVAITPTPTDPAVTPPATTTPVETPDVRSFVGRAESPAHPLANHDLKFSIDEALKITGESTWLPDSFSGGNPVKVVLTGSLSESGRLQMQDNGPEVNPQYNRGFYVGQLNSATGGFTGTYSEVTSSSATLFTMDWTAVPA